MKRRVARYLVGGICIVCQGKRLKPEVAAQNQKLAVANRIEGYPTILFFNAKGEAVGRWATSAAVRRSG